MTGSDVTLEPRPLPEQLRKIPAGDGSYASRFVDTLLSAAMAVRVSDLHLQPSAAGLDVSWRMDGMLHAVGSFARGESSDIVTRLKVLADLLTYRTDIPQEGRIRQPATNMEMRVSTFPTLFGERAVVRLFAAADQLLYPEALGLAAEEYALWTELLRLNAGVAVVSGPAGSGKTTTAYASLRHILREHHGARSILTIEDPIEVPLAGAAQSQVQAASGFDLASALRSALRQDPEVLLVGEIRDPEVARGVFNAALTGHLVLTTLHAGSAAQAVCRLAEMEIEPYLLQSGLRAVLNQRLVRRLCACAEDVLDPAEFLGLPVTHAKRAAGCPACQHTGYLGRVLIAELLLLNHSPFNRALATRVDSEHLEQIAIESGMIPRWQRGAELVESGATSPAEIHRVLQRTAAA